MHSRILSWEQGSTTLPPAATASVAFGGRLSWHQPSILLCVGKHTSASPVASGLPAGLLPPPLEPLRGRAAGGRQHERRRRHAVCAGAGAAAAGQVGPGVFCLLYCRCAGAAPPRRMLLSNAVTPVPMVPTLAATLPTLSPSHAPLQVPHPAPLCRAAARAARGAAAAGATRAAGAARPQPRQRQQRRGCVLPGGLKGGTGAVPRAGGTKGGTWQYRGLLAPGSPLLEASPCEPTVLAVAQPSPLSPPSRPCPVVAPCRWGRTTCAATRWPSW